VTTIATSLFVLLQSLAVACIKSSLNSELMSSAVFKWQNREALGEVKGLQQEATLLCRKCRLPVLPAVHVDSHSLTITRTETCLTTKENELCTGDCPVTFNVINNISDTLLFYLHDLWNCLSHFFKIQKKIKIIILYVHFTSPSKKQK